MIGPQPLIVALFYSSTGSKVGSNSRWVSSLVCALLLATSFISVSCGRVGDPLPPIRQRALQPETVRVVQNGDSLLLTWPKPTANALQQSRIIRAEILRREETTDTPRRLVETDFVEQARIIGTINTRDILAFEGTILQFADPLPLDSPVINPRYRYAIRYIRLAEAALPLSNYAFVDPVRQIARPPAMLQTQQFQDKIQISWNPPTANLDNSTPPVVLGYNIYRRNGQQPFGNQPLNSTPLMATMFEDRQFRFGQKYSYMVRSISAGRDGQIESPSSMEITINATDTFPPTAVTNVTGASAAGIVSLFWPANSERDLRGYYVYRAELANAARSDWQRLTPAAITTTTFRDERAIVGKTYYYFVTALDVADNEGEPSMAVDIEVVQ
jgi:fibronectin type 3 domain-containing protein